MTLVVFADSGGTVDWRCASCDALVIGLIGVVPRLILCRWVDRAASWAFRPGAIAGLLQTAADRVFDPLDYAPLCGRALPDYCAGILPACHQFFSAVRCHDSEIRCDRFTGSTLLLLFGWSVAYRLRSQCLCVFASTGEGVHYYHPSDTHHTIVLIKYT